jgi:hypothetical protein
MPPHGAQDIGVVLPFQLRARRGRGAVAELDRAVDRRCPSPHLGDRGIAQRIVQPAGALPATGFVIRQTHRDAPRRQQCHDALDVGPPERRDNGPGRHSALGRM